MANPFSCGGIGGKGYALALQFEADCFNLEVAAYLV
jgi:hypothetical protein